jgi:hypothetical protein
MNNRELETALTALQAQLAAVTADRDTAKAAQAEAERKASEAMAAATKPSTSRGYKVSEKGAITFRDIRPGQYGGLTLYLSEITRILASLPDVRLFALANGHKIASYEANVPCIGITNDDRNVIAAWHLEPIPAIVPVEPVVVPVVETTA